MYSLKLFTIILFSLTLALILQTSFGAAPIFHFCSSSENFTSHSLYESNLKTLINSLIDKTPPTGFGVVSVGQYQNQKAYGLSLCRGDVSASECKTCVSEATKEILNLCPYNKGAIIWYDNCLFKYLDTDFNGKIDEANKFFLWNGQNVSDPNMFNYMTKELLSVLAYKASVDPKMYASGKLMIGVSEKVYGLAQCTRDLTSMGCKKCLDDAISELPSCCDGEQGGRVVGGSCNIRYEIYPFLKE
ncbi:cysteine-rich repeat secretory protein 38-like [Gastrolobium bilobum]|uniref:cysteine-rich repeat secretory protein 38-like n=1 Tax=Gastrolobium bilobum TaxID=150636 RepID=UPI002AB0E88F|nr:cysteine-rich repeat secretory protein 38-like [Gastrolobium bilobum]